MQDVSVWSLLGRLVVSLVVVIALMMLTARVLRGRAGGRATPRRPGSSVRVVERHNVGRGSSIALVRAGDKALVVGITEQRISLLAEADAAQLDDQESEAERTRPNRGRNPGTPWTDLLESLRDRTARRS